MTAEPQFSTELKILSGEWLIYCAIKRYFEDMFEDEDMYSFSQFPQIMPIEQKFELCPIHVAWHALFGDAYLLMLQAGILRSEKRALFADCKYSEIPEKIRANIGQVTYSIPYAFTLIAGSHNFYFRENERQYIFIEERCEPLFKTLQKEGFCKQKDDRYYWTSELRSYLEHHGIWRKPNAISEEEKLLDSLTEAIKEEIATCAKAKDIVSACYVLTELAGARLDVAKSLLENYMYPKIWGKPPKPDFDIVFRWFGPN